MCKFENLQKAVLNVSENKTNFNLACDEWFICNAYKLQADDPKLVCVCGKEGLVNIFEIQNKINRVILCPIGSECIKKFENFDLTTEMNLAMNGNKVFNNNGNTHHGKTYNEICSKYPSYVEYLKTHGTKKRYIELVKFFDFFKVMKERRENFRE
jgi:hypothetical protein